MVPGVPYAIAAKFAHPDRPVVCFVGDGAFQMLGMNEMLTVKRYMDRWQDKRLVFCVFANQDLNQVTWEQRVMEGDPKFPGTQWLPELDYAAYAELAGLKGITCAKGDDMRAAWEEALSAGVPVVLEVKTDPDVPPLPPHITLEQARKMARAMRSDPDRAGVMEKALRGKLAELTERLTS
jgi:pyruvate dehydrogenase (quinone)